MLTLLLLIFTIPIILLIIDLKVFFCLLGFILDNIFLVFIIFILFLLFA